MQIEELLNEYQKIGTPTFTIPARINVTKLGKQATMKGAGEKLEYEVEKRSEGNQSVFFAVLNDQVIGFATISRYTPPYVMVRNVHTIEGYQGVGVMQSLFHFIVKNQNLKLLSDTLMSDAGEALWKSLMYHGRLKISIADIRGGEEYRLDQVGITKTQDGVTVIDPKDDTAEPEDQRFFYLAEGRKKYDEQGEYTVGTVIPGNRLYESYIVTKEMKEKSLIQPMIIFGKPWP